MPDAQWNFKRRMVALQTTLRTWFDDHARRRRSCRSCLMPSGISSDAWLLCKPRCALDVMPDAHRRYESFDPFVLLPLLRPRKAWWAPQVWPPHFGGSPVRERHFEIEAERFRILVLRKS